VWLALADGAELRMALGTLEGKASFFIKLLSVVLEATVRSRAVLDEPYSFEGHSVPLGLSYGNRLSQFRSQLTGCCLSERIFLAIQKVFTITSWIWANDREAPYCCHLAFNVHHLALQVNPDIALLDMVVRIAEKRLKAHEASAVWVVNGVHLTKAFLTLFVALLLLLESAFRTARRVRFLLI